MAKLVIELGEGIKTDIRKKDGIFVLEVYRESHHGEPVKKVIPVGDVGIDPVILEYLTKKRD